jgi:hypothetical protein
MAHLYIYATDRETRERALISDLYWFAEHGVHDWGGEGHSPSTYRLEVWVDDTCVFDSQAPGAAWTPWF